MANILKTTQALQVLQYLSPPIVILYFFFATVVSVLRLETLEEHASSRLRKTVFYLLLLNAVLYIAQAGVIIDLIFVKPGLYGADSTNVHSLASVLVWIIISTTLLTFENCTWYPYCGAWTLGLGFEVTILALSLSLQRPTTGAEIGFVTLQGAQIALLLFLTALFFASYSFKSETTGKEDEERASLLASTEEENGYAATNSHVNNDANGAANAKKPQDRKDDDSDSSSDSDDDVDPWTKKENKKKAQMKKRLKEEGGWFTYLKGFSLFLPYLWPARNLYLKFNLLGVVICMLAERVLRPLEPRQLGILVNTLSLGSPGKAFAALAVYISLNAASSNISLVRGWLWLPIETNTSARMEKASYNHIMELSCDFHDSKRTGEVFEAMRQGQSVVDLIETIGFTLVPEVADLLIACIYFYWLFDAYMVLIGLATGVIYICISAWSTRKSGARRREMNKTWREKSQIKYDTVGGWKTVSYFNRVPHSQERFGGAIDRSNKLYLAYKLFWNYMYSVQGIIMDLGLFSACVLAVYDIMYRGIPVGSFVTLMTYWGNLTGPLASLSHTSSSLIFDLIDAESLLRIWQRRPIVKDGPNELALENGHVKFENVSFKYEKKEAIEDISFEAKPGQTIALVGETGAGKSTILKLLFRFYDVNNGMITIDGQNIRDITLQSLRENIGVVPQDPALFNVSIIDNLRFAKLDATDEEIFDACKAAAVHDKVMTFSKGYASKVGERGVKLSGGELQRIAIARAILKNPSIVLLDEATSSVDSETEAKIQEGLDRLCFNRTTFVVAHRLSTIQHADQILVIKDGKILEQGTPSELIEKKGKYYALWTKQMGIFDPFAPKEEKNDGETGDEEYPISVDVPKEKAYESDNPESQSNKRKPGQSRDISSASQEITKDAAVPLLAQSPIKGVFRPNAPEFVPKSRRGDSQSEANTEPTRGPPYAAPEIRAADSNDTVRRRKKQMNKSASNTTAVDSASSSSTSQAGTIMAQCEAKPERARSRAQSQSEAARPASSTPGPGSGALHTATPGLFALQQVAIGSATDGAVDGKR